MRLLFLAGRYAPVGSPKWLLQELAEELASRGHDVDVLVTDPTGAVPSGPLESVTPGVRAFQVPGWERGHLPRIGPGKYLTQAVRMRVDPRVSSFLKGHYDACLFTSPGAVNAGLPGALKRRGHARSLVMILWDFFPVANVEIGALRVGRLGRALRRLEERIVQGVDGLVLMSPANERFLDAYYARVSARRLITPPWGVPEPIGSHPQRYPAFTVVWGGQITFGRALDDLIEVAARADVREAPVHFTIVGDGPARPHFEQLVRESGATNVEFVGQLPRPDYVTLLRRCHLATSLMGEMSVPSFPSKTVDYCQAGLPVLAAVESGTDYGEIIQAAGFGVVVRAGDRQALANTLLDLAAPDGQARLEEMGRASRRFFEQELDVRVAADRIEEFLWDLSGRRR